MRLLKLLAWAILGYVIYEMYLGMVEGEGQTEGGGGEQRRQGQRGRGVRQRLTGAGHGRRAEVSDASGATRTETVGRGVTSA